MNHNRNQQMLWLLKPGTKPCLPYESFTKKQTPLSLELYKILNRHFSLMAGDIGPVVDAFDHFDQSSREHKGIEASPILVREYPQHDIFLANIKGRKKETLVKVLEEIQTNQDVRKLLSAPNLNAVWRTATVPEDSIIGGFHPEGQFMVLFGRTALNSAKSIFNFVENPGRYKPRAERSPAFISSGRIAISIIEYPNQIDKAIEQLAGFKQTCPHDLPETFCFIKSSITIEDRAKFDALKENGKVLHFHHDVPPKIIRMLLKDSVAILGESRPVTQTSAASPSQQQPDCLKPV